ncbi:MAG: hypothetical protein WCF85_02465 [Rhodospirillaceae bacterium]
MSIIPFEVWQRARDRRNKAKQPQIKVDNTEDIAGRITTGLDELKAEIKALRADLKSHERRLTIRFAIMMTASTLIIVTMMKLFYSGIL